MKQKDKKQHIRNTGRLRCISLPDPNILDDDRASSNYKSSRIASKVHHSYKSGMKLESARVIEVMSNYQCILRMQDQDVTASISGRLKQFIFQTRTIIAVGDFVEVETSSAPDYRIEKIKPRRNLLTRYDTGSFQKEIVLAANIDQVIVTTSWRMPMLKPGLIDRYLILAAKHKIRPIIVVNKVDLCEDISELDEEIAYYRQMDYRVVLTSAETGAGMDELKEILKDKDSIFSGHSGAGKSSLINYLEPSINQLTAEVSDFNEKGKHTTTQAVMLPWSFGGYLVDTPGIKTINLHHGDKALIPKLFPGFDRYYPQCRFRDCTHVHEADCAVLAALEAGDVDPSRYDSYIGILGSL